MARCILALSLFLTSCASVETEGELPEFPQTIFKSL